MCSKLYKVIEGTQSSIGMNENINISNSFFNELWSLKKGYLTLTGDRYRMISREEWFYKSPNTEFESRLTIIEGGILHAVLSGKPTLEMLSEAFVTMERIVEMFELKEHGVAVVLDVTGIKKNRKQLLKSYAFNLNRLMAGVKCFSVVSNQSKFVKAIFGSSIQGVSQRESLEICLKELKKNAVKNEQVATNNVLTNKRIDELYELISQMSFNSTGEIKKVELPTEDPFHKVFQALEFLSEDKQSLVESLNEALLDTQEELQERNAHFKALFQNSSFSIGLLDANQTLVDFNSNLYQHFKKKGVVVVKGKPLADFLTEKERSIFFSHQLEVKASKSSEFEGEVLYEDGTERWWKTKFFPVRVSEDKLFSAFICEDITTEYTLKNEQKKILKNVQLQNDLLTSLNHKVAHELNHHAASITQLLSHYSDKELSIENKVDFVMNLQDLASKLNATIDDINTVAHADQLNEFNSKIVITNDAEAKKKLGKIMLVDDDNITNVMNEHLLKKKINNCVVTKYLKGQEALKHLLENKSDQPDVILLDINMPDIDGWDFLDVLMKSNVNIEVHMLTSSKNPTEKEKALKYPMVKSFLNKPLDVSKIEKLAS